MRYIPFYNEISHKSVEDLLIKLQMADSPNCIYIDSPGGTFEFFSSMAPAIKRRGITTVSGQVKSAAIILSLLGHKRQAVPDASFFFHEVRAVPNGEEITICDLENFLEAYEEIQGKESELIQEWLRKLRHAEDWFLSFVSRETGMHRSVFQNLMRADATLSAKEAKRYGIIHEIVRLDE